MLSGNCSVNAQIITFNAPIKKPTDVENKRGMKRVGKKATQCGFDFDFGCVNQRICARSRSLSFT